MPSSAPVHLRYRPDIDGLRTLAIVPVVVFHAFPALAPGGFVGVDIFFVISGYLISLIIFGSLAQGRFRFADFYGRRIRRIFPSLLLVLVASYAAGWFLLLPDEFRMLGKHIAASAGFVQNFALQREAGYFDVASELKPLMHLWSLAVEEQFYLFFPLLIWLLWRGRLQGRAPTLVLALLSLGWAIKATGSDPAQAFFWTPLRAWELLAGSLLAHLQAFPGTLAHWLGRFSGRPLDGAPTDGQGAEGREGAHAALRLLAAVCGLLAILASVALFSAKTPWPGLGALLPTAGAVLLIASGPQTWVHRRLLSARPMVGIGLISYPLYLWHWPLLSFMRIIEDGTPDVRWRTAAVLASLALAALTYLLVEKPLRHSTIALHKSLAWGCAMALVGYIGFNAHARDGLAFRLRHLQEHQDTLDVRKNGPWAKGPQARTCLDRFHPQIAEQFLEHFFCERAPGADAPNTLLIGDSHALSLYPGLAQSLSGSPWKLEYIAATSTAPLWGLAWVNNATSEDVFSAIRALNQEMRRYIFDNPQLKTIILAGRWPVYFHSAGFGGEEENQSVTVRSFLRPELTQAEAIFAHSLRTTLAELTGAGRQVLVLLDNPELGFHPKSCLDSRPLRLSANAVRNPCAVPRETFEQRSHGYREVLQAIAADFPQVTVVDGSQSFCDGQWCWALREGQLLYYDDDHVSLAGARLMGQQIRQALEASARP